MPAPWDNYNPDEFTQEDRQRTRWTWDQIDEHLPTLREFKALRRFLAIAGIIAAAAFAAGVYLSSTGQLP